MASVLASNLAADTTKQEVSDFFTFCGKISECEIENDPDHQGLKRARITFVSKTAAETALLMENAKLRSSKIKVSRPAESAAAAAAAAPEEKADLAATDKDELYQEDKPRAAIFAELLSHGYVIADEAVQKGIDFDKQHGASQRFQSWLNSTLATLEETLHVKESSKAVDDKYHVSKKGQTMVEKVTQYFEHALDNPAGKRVREFYKQGQKTIMDIHNEARRLADLRSEKSPEDGQPTVIKTDQTQSLLK